MAARPGRARLSARLLVAAFLALGVFAARAEPVSGAGLIGTEIVNADGRRLGVIEDLAIDVENGEVRYAMLRKPDVLPGGDRLYPVPLQSFSRAYQGGQLILRSVQDAAPAAAGGSAQDARMRRLTTLLDQAVAQPGGERLGRIRDVIVDLETGAVQSVVVREERGSREELREIPSFDALRLL